jgi:hypothetical protein
MNCPYHQRRMAFVRRVGMFRWFTCPECKTTDWRMEDGQTGAKPFRKEAP